MYICIYIYTHIIYIYIYYYTIIGVHMYICMHISLCYHITTCHWPRLMKWTRFGGCCARRFENEDEKKRKDYDMSLAKLGMREGDRANTSAGSRAYMSVCTWCISYLACTWCHTGVCEKENTPPEKQRLGKISCQSTKSGSGEQFLLRDCVVAKARVKGMCCSQTPAWYVVM